MKKIQCRHLVLILGDQLDEDSSAFEGFDPAQDVVLMVEAFEESTHVWSHKIRTTLFLSSMRHFADSLKQRGWQVDYRKLELQGDKTLHSGLLAAIEQHQPQAVIGVEPGDLRVRQQIEASVKGSMKSAIKSGTASAHKAKATTLNDAENGLKNSAPSAFLTWREDKHFLCSLPQFRKWAGTSASLRMEFFYRNMRKQYKVLVEGKANDEPVGGKWNFDADNRKSFGRAGPQDVPKALAYPPDAITRDVIALVNNVFADHPGQLDGFNWPVTRAQALVALKDFIDNRLPVFGPHEDAMWTNLNFGWHSLLSSSLNLKLLNPLEVVLAAEQAYKKHDLDLASVEGFIRQILGWREFMRGVYFLDMPELKTANHYGHTNALPAWYWTGDTDMNCISSALAKHLKTAIRITSSD